MCLEFKMNSVYFFHNPIATYICLLFIHLDIYIIRLYSFNVEHFGIP